MDNSFGWCCMETIVAALSVHDTFVVNPQHYILPFVSMCVMALESLLLDTSATAHKTQITPPV